MSCHARDWEHRAQLQWHFLGKNLPGPSLPHSCIPQAGRRPPALLQPHTWASLHPVQRPGAIELPGLAAASPVLPLQPAGSPRQLWPAPTPWARREAHVVFPPFQWWSRTSFSPRDLGNPLETVVPWAATASAASHCNSQVRGTRRAAQGLSKSISRTLWWDAGGDEKGLSGDAWNMGLLFSLGQRLPQNARWNHLLSPPLWRVYRELPFPHQGEAGFASQGDWLDKAKVTQLLLDHAAVIMPIFYDLCIFSFCTVRHPAG